MATPVERLEAMLQDFDGRTSAGANHPGAQLRAQLNAAPELKARILDSIANGQLERFNPLSPDSGAGATFDGAGKSIQLPIDTLAKSMTNGAARAEIIFSLGHEIQHSRNSEFGSKTNEAFDQEVKTITARPSPHDYTRAVGGYIAAYRNNEASAHIGGFNALVAQVRRDHPDATLKDVYRAHPTRMQDFIEIKRDGGHLSYEIKPGLSVDNKTLQMPETHDNVASMARYYFDKRVQPQQGLGTHHDQNYRTYYAHAALDRILKIEDMTQANAVARDPSHPRALVQLDTQALGVNAATLHTGTFFQELGETHAPRGTVPTVTPSTSRAPASQGVASPIADASIDRADSPLYVQAVAALDRLGPQSGIASSDERRAVAAAMAVRAQGDGLQRIDMAVRTPSGDRLFAVQGDPTSPVSMRSYVDRVEAASQPVEANLARLQPAAVESPAVEHAHVHAHGMSR